MLKRAFILAISTILLTNCSWHRFQAVKKPPSLPPTPAQIITVSESIADFSKVKINGKIDVDLHSGARSNAVVFHGIKEDIASVERFVKYGELHINLGKKIPRSGYMKVDIYMPKITSFIYNGSGNISLTGLSSACLDVEVDNNKNTSLQGSFGLGRAKFSNIGHTNIRGVRGCSTNLILMDDVKVNLSGYANISNLNMGGNSELSLYWVKSKTLYMKLKDNARAQLSGTVETFNSEQWDTSRLNIRYLMAQNSFVKTHDSSEADIAVIRNQHTLAKDKSNIYYYTLPETNSDFMAKNGSVLDMREFPYHYNR